MFGGSEWQSSHQNGNVVAVDLSDFSRNRQSYVRFCGNGPVLILGALNSSCEDDNCFI